MKGGEKKVNATENGICDTETIRPWENQEDDRGIWVTLVVTDIVYSRKNQERAAKLASVIAGREGGALRLINHLRAERILRDLSQRMYGR